MSLTNRFDTLPFFRRPPRVEELHYRRYAVILMAALLGTLGHAGFAALMLGVGVPRLALANLVGVILWLIALIVNRHGRHTLALLLIYSETASHATLAVWLLGPASGFHFYLWPVACLATLTADLRPYQAAVLGLIGMALFSVLQTGILALPGPSPLTDMLAAMGMVNVLLASFSLVAFILIVRRFNEEQEHHLTHLANRDALTDLYNRHFTVDFLRQLVESSERSHTPACLALGDIDNFKRINDQHGHDTGDACLKAVADQLRRNFRRADCLCRWGGEEFLIALPGTRLEDVTGVLERFSAALHEHPVAVDGRPVPVTMSFGVIELAPGEGFEEAVGRADRLLYRAKAQGRDRIISERSPPISKNSPLGVSRGDASASGHTTDAFGRPDGPAEQWHGKA